MRTLSIILLLLYLSALDATGTGAAAAQAPESVSTEVADDAKRFPFEVTVSFSAALFHWVDSLAGTSGGKTDEAHRRQYAAFFGPPTRAELDAIEAFRLARSFHARHVVRSGETARRRGRVAMLRIFLEAPTIADALSTVRGELNLDLVEGLAASLHHFRPRYEKIWNEDEAIALFLDSFETGARRRRLDRLLLKIASCYDVERNALIVPRLVLMPVPRGRGTHAQAVGRNLMIEIRPGDDIDDQASVIVHEAAHLLWEVMPADRKRALYEYAITHGEQGANSWRLLREGLPTALGQGYADELFRPFEWEKPHHWYHIDEVDRFARQIYPVVKRAVALGLPFDEQLIDAAIATQPEQNLMEILSQP